MLKFLGKGSKLIVIFIFTVIVSGSILTYLSIIHISNYRELMEKKISEEERELTKRFSLDFQNSIEALTLKFSDYYQFDSLTNLRDLKSFDSINGLINYVVLDSKGSFISPNFVNNNQPLTELNSSKSFVNSLRNAENNEFIDQRLIRAEILYLEALKVAGTKLDSVHIYNSLGRLYVKMNQKKKAFNTYQTILTKFSNTSNSSGFPYAYYSIIKLLRINGTSNFEQYQKLILSFLNNIVEGIIPLNASTSELLELILEWQHQFQDMLKNKHINDLIVQIKNSLALINNYKIPIEKILEEKNKVLTINNTVNYLNIKPIDGHGDELMFFYQFHSNYIGFVIGLNPLFKQTLQKQQMNHFKFEYDIKLVEKTANDYLLNTNIMMLTEFSPYFKENLIQVSLKKEDVIDEAVFRRKISYGIGLIMFLGTMVFGLYLLIQDVNREKKMNKLRSDFVSNVTHELKTPLTSINMFAEALNMGKVSSISKQKKYINSIVKESEKLKRMINNILEFSKKENNSLTYNLEYSNLTDIVNATLKEMDYFLEINKIDLQANIENNIYANIHAQGIKLALSNLISNAIKYASFNKKMNIQLFKTELEIFIEVEDFGIGIPKEKLELIFEKFYRVNSHENETASGTGLGLTVTKAIIEEQHGKLLVESTLGKGSKFTIVLNTA